MQFLNARCDDDASSGLHRGVVAAGLAVVLGVAGASGSVAAAEAAARIVAESTEPLIPGTNFPLRKWEVERIDEGVYGFRHGFYRTMFIVAGDGVIVADPLNVEAAGEMRRQIAKLTDLPVKYVAYSHSHFDHAAGGRIFKEEGAVFVAHEQCVRNWAEHSRDDVVPADVTFADEYTIRLDGASLQLNYFGPSHDNCMSTMLVKPANLLMTVDTGNLPTGWTMFYNPGVSDDRIGGMVPWFRRVEELVRREGVQTVIGAHMNVGRDDQGRPTLVRATTGPAATLSERREFWEGMIDEVRADLAAGTSPDEVPDRLVERQALADRVAGYDGPKMRQLFQRIVVFVRTGE